MIATADIGKKSITRLTAGISLAVIIASPAIFLFIVFGRFGGMPWDYTLVYVSESQPGLRGFLYGGDNLRILTNAFYHLGYLISQGVGQDGSFIGYHIVYAVLWIARSGLTFLLCKSLGLGGRVGLAAAAITAFHGSDYSIGHVGQINQFGIAALALLSILLFTYSITARPIARIFYLMGAAAVAAFAVWSHEAVLFGLIVAPILILLACRRLSALWWTAVACEMPLFYYASLMADRLIFHPTGNSMQEAVTRGDIGRLRSLISDAWVLLESLFNAPAWIAGKYLQRNVTLSSAINDMGVQVFVWGGVLAILCAGAVAFMPVNRAINLRRQVEFALVFLAIAAAFVIPFLALDLNSLPLWRTQILPSPFAAIAFSLVLSIIADRIAQPSLAKAALAAVLAGILCCGMTANIISYQQWNLLWRRVGTPIARILETVPSVEPQTIIMLQGIPLQFAAWDSNFWFDYLLRLAYPHKLVAGSYTFAGDPDQPTDVKIAESGGGTVMTLSDRRKILAPHGQIFGVNGNNVELIKPFMPVLITKATLDQLIVLQWTGSGPMTLVLDIKKVDVAVAPSANYSPQLRIRQPESPIASRRFSP